jgi:hypothetical protein
MINEFFDVVVFVDSRYEIFKIKLSVVLKSDLFDRSNKQIR